ncbi:phage tail tube protein [Halomonas elongata]|uniref:phage tail tube protein n=1 Tax=Halomonas elongata TaxID=2746 RepID=UPI0023B0F1C0|nr:phage tail tube protein [Halomonas elongata]
MAESNQYKLSMRLAGSGNPWQVLRRTDGGPGITTNMTNPNEVDSSGQDSSMLLTSITVGGNVSIAFSAKTYDMIIRNVMGSDWVVDGTDPTLSTIIIGKDTPKLEFLVQYMDVGAAGKAYMIGEANVSQLQLSLSAGEVVSGSFSIVGESYNADYDFSADTFEDETITKPINAAQDVNELVIEGDTVMDVCVNTMDITINRNYQEDPCIGHEVPHQFKGTAQVTGNISLALTESTFGLLKDSINEKEFGVRLDMNDGTAGNSYLIETFRTKLGVEMPSGGRDTVLRPAVSFTALKDPNIGSFIRVSRTLAA